MAFTKYASVEEILEIKSSQDRLDYDPAQDSLSKFAALRDGVHEEDGYLYVRCRAISSRVNKNNDGWPSAELAAAYDTFRGRPIFVDHNNDNPQRTRGVIVSSKLHREDERTSALDPYYSGAPDNHKPPTWIELLLEVDAKTFPRLAEAVKTGHIDAVSMGANISSSVCSVCANEASTPNEYCKHVKSKGLEFEIESSTGERVRKKAYEDCYGINFFEISFVFDPADETALISEHSNSHLAKVASPFGTSLDDIDQYIEPVGTQHSQDDRNFIPQSELITAPREVDTLRDENMCPVCNSDTMQSDPDGISRCPTCGHVQEPEPLNNPDLETARDADIALENQGQQNTQENGLEDQVEQVQISPVTNPTNRPISAGVIGEMKILKSIFSTNSKLAADEVLPTDSGQAAPPENGGGGTTIPLVFSGGIHNVTQEAFKAEGLEAVITYQNGKSINLPNDPIMKAIFTQAKLAKETGLSAAELGNLQVSVQPVQGDLNRMIELIQNGGEGYGPPQGGGGAPQGAPQAAPQQPISKKRSAVKKSPKATILPTGATSSDKPADATVVSDQLAPVESKIEIREAKCGEHDKPATSCEDCKADRDEAKAKEATKTSEHKLFEVFALADELVDLGIIDRATKMAFVAELENETLESIDARRKMLTQFKEAGVTRQQPSRVAGVSRIPRLANNVSSVVASNGGMGLLDVPDESIFV